VILQIHTIAILLLPGAAGELRADRSYEEMMATLRGSIGFEPYPCPGSNACYCARVGTGKETLPAPLRYARAQYCPAQVESKAAALAFTSWDERGNMVDEGLFVNAEMHGLWTTWHPNGAKAGESRFENGRQRGPFTRWHDNKQISVTGSYQDDKPHGNGFTGIERVV
jgi:hypothetical protein